MSQLVPNRRMPRMYHHVAEHAARCAHLSWTERGVLECARDALWSVEGCKMPVDVLRTRLRASPGSDAEAALAILLDPAMGLLSVAADGVVCDPAMVDDWAASVEKAEINRANALKRSTRGKTLPPSLTEQRDGPPEF